VESVSGIETLKALAVEPQMQRRWEERLASYVQASFRVANLGNIGSQSVQLLSKLVTAATLYFGARLVMQGSLTVGELVAFNMLAARVAQPVLRLAQIWQDFHQARLSIARLGDILNCHPEPSYNPSRSALPAIRGEIAFERVTFRYRVGIPMLETKLERDRPLQEEAESVTQNQQREAEQVAPIVPDDVRFLFEPRPLILHEDPAIMIAWSNR
jgi:subfamily B ATP-binding cassette protein HlyB/CyaB